MTESKVIASNVRSPELTVKVSPASDWKVRTETPFKAIRFSGVKETSFEAMPGRAHAERRAAPASAESAVERTNRRLEIDMACLLKIESDRLA